MNSDNSSLLIGNLKMFLRRLVAALIFSCVRGGAALKLQMYGYGDSGVDNVGDHKRFAQKRPELYETNDTGRSFESNYNEMTRHLNNLKVAINNAIDIDIGLGNENALAEALRSAERFFSDEVKQIRSAIRQNAYGEKKVMDTLERALGTLKGELEQFTRSPLVWGNPPVADFKKELEQKGYTEEAISALPKKITRIENILKGLKRMIKDHEDGKSTLTKAQLTQGHEYLLEQSTSLYFLTNEWLLRTINNG